MSASANDSRPTRSFFAELRRRKVIRTCLFYVLICWGIVQVAEVLAPALGFDGAQAIRMFLAVAFVGFPITALVAWFYQVTENGIERTDAFVERRILNNIPPINERRRDGVSTYFGKGKEPQQYDWVVSVETGPLAGLSFGIDRTMIFGRSLDCDISLVTPHVSRQHAQISVDEVNLYIEDLGSANGTIVNGKQIGDKRELHHEDEIRLHDIVFRVSESFTRPASERQALNETTFINKDDLE